MKTFLLVHTVVCGMLGFVLFFMAEVLLPGTHAYLLLAKPLGVCMASMGVLSVLMLIMPHSRSLNEAGFIFLALQHGLLALVYLISFQDELTSVVLPALHGILWASAIGVSIYKVQTQQKGSRRLRRQRA